MLAQADEELPLPESVQGIIAARLDTLPPDEKTLVQAAAIVGKVFWPGATEEMLGGFRSEVEQAVHALERKEFVRRERRSSVAGETAYVFRHVLVRDVAYSQIPRKRRADIHRLAAGWIETLAGDRPEDLADMVAHHYLSALDLDRRSGREDPELAARARTALVEAGTGRSPSTPFRPPPASTSRRWRLRPRRMQSGPAFSWATAGLCSTPRAAARRPGAKLPTNSWRQESLNRPARPRCAGRLRPLHRGEEPGVADEPRPGRLARRREPAFGRQGGRTRQPSPLPHDLRRDRPGNSTRRRGPGTRDESGSRSCRRIPSTPAALRDAERRPRRRRGSRACGEPRSTPLLRANAGVAQSRLDAGEAGDLERGSRSCRAPARQLDATAMWSQWVGDTQQMDSYSTGAWSELLPRVEEMIEMTRSAAPVLMVIDATSFGFDCDLQGETWRVPSRIGPAARACAGPGGSAGSASLLLRREAKFSMKSVKRKKQAPLSTSSLHGGEKARALQPAPGSE